MNDSRKCHATSLEVAYVDRMGKPSIVCCGIRFGHLICDPWLDGTAFNHGWRLISPTVCRYEDFARITHIWFSHEHPDHFSPSNVRRIPEHFRRKITVLLHYTKDKRLLNVCKAYGFQVQELPELEQVELAAGFRLICGRPGLIDSWMAIFAECKSILNMNDCIFRQRDDSLLSSGCWEESMY